MFDANESIDDLKDNYYDKYKFMVGGYGIYLDKDLNVEYGYYTTEAPACGHGAGYTEFYDFKDARDDDIIKEKIYSQHSSCSISIYDASVSTFDDSNRLNDTGKGLE